MNIQRIHQIEITSRCNLKCKYCVHPNMLRVKEDMTEEMFSKALELVKYSVVYNRQRELNLAGIGESTLHPLFPEFVAEARGVLGDSINIVLATNGIHKNLDELEDIIIRIAPYKPSIFVSIHRPERAAYAVALYKKYGLLSGISADPSIASVDWAGQVDFPVSTPLKDTPCDWLSKGMAMVSANGDILQCCFDGDGGSKVGHLDDGFGIFDKEVSPHRLCPSCHLNVPGELSNKDIWNKHLGIGSLHE